MESENRGGGSRQNWKYLRFSRSSQPKELEQESNPGWSEIRSNAGTEEDSQGRSVEGWSRLEKSPAAPTPSYEEVKTRKAGTENPRKSAEDFSRLIHLFTL